MKKKSSEKTYSQYKQELEQIVLDMSDSSKSFEEMTVLYRQGSQIIEILEKILTEEIEIDTNIVSD